MPRTFTTDDATLADAMLMFYKAVNGLRFRSTVHSTDRSFHADHDEDLSEALTAMVSAGVITAAQRTAFVAVAQELRRRARQVLGLI